MIVFRPVYYHTSFHHFARCFFQRRFSILNEASETASRLANFQVSKITSDGVSSLASVNLEDIKRGSSIHARDLISLALPENGTKDADKRKGLKMSVRKPSPAILPRGKKIIVSFGHVRAVIGEDEGLLFDAYNPSIKIFASQLATTFKRRSLLKRRHSKYSEKENENLKISFSEDAFEVVFLEEILREVCDNYRRKVFLLQPIVDSLTTTASGNFLADTGIQRLMPLRRSLQSFELQVTLAVECLTTLLNDDEDMLKLLLHEQSHAQSIGVQVDVVLHENVELLIEEYARQLLNTSQEIDYLIKQVQGCQEHVKISLDTYRNSMLQTTIYLGISSLCFASSTVVAGFFGMNLVSGFEESSSAFRDVILVTSVSSGVMFLCCTYLVSAYRFSKLSLEKLKETENITGVLNHLCMLDYVIRKCDDEEVLTKAGLKMMLDSVTDIKESEFEILFKALDRNDDHLIQYKEYRLKK